MTDSKLLLFADRVVIVTGAGGGLGKAYALAFAERGASLVVNDLGGDIKGGGKSTRAADVVVDEIKSKGGKAVANYDSVENAESIIKTALDAFGRIDILINNAGILRDKSFLRTSDDDWDIIHRIHLRASFLLTRAAWPHMQKNNFGRIIMTSSAAGIYGNFGQANYSAAKLALLGLSNTLAIEGAKYNIKCNTIAPVARSRLTETVMPEEILENLRAEYVSPLVLYLTHESSDETGALFEVGGGWIGKLRWQKSAGIMLGKADQFYTPEEVRENWSQITSFDNPIYHTTIGESTNFVLNKIDEMKNGKSQLQEQETDSGVFSYNSKDIILYALSLGFTTSEGLNFIYENHPQFVTFPSYGVIPSQSCLMDSLSNVSLPNGVNIDPTRLLHGEHYLELYKQLPTSGLLRREFKLVDVLDKGSGASLVLNVECFNEKNEKVCLNQFVIFLVGSGGFGGKRDSDSLFKVSVKKFDRVPDAIVEEKTHVDQAALYRLNGDLNPLHIDPEFASMGGFSQPILHGLCTFGLAIKHVLKSFCDNDVSCFKSIKVRFNKPTIPGQTIRTHMWLEEQQQEAATIGNKSRRVYFECRTIENDNTVITGAYVDLHRIKTNINVFDKQTVVKAEETSYSSQKVFDELTNKIKENPDVGKKLKAVYVFVIKKSANSKETKTWTVDLKSNQIYDGEAKQGTKADCTITLEDDDFVQLSIGKLNAQQMFMKGKLKIKGNIMMAQKLGTLFKENAKL